MELIVGLFWSYGEDGRMKVRFHMESVTLVDGLFGLEGLVMIFGLAGVEGDVVVRAVRVIAFTGIFFILKIIVLFVWCILFILLTLDLKKEITNPIFMFYFYYYAYLPKHLKES